MKRGWKLGAALLLLFVTGCGSAAADSAETMANTSIVSKVQPETLISYEGGTYLSAQDDENALCLSGGTAVLEDITVQKIGGVATDIGAGDLDGMNAALLAKDGVNVSIAHAIISSTAQSGSGVFCRSEGSLVTIYNSVVTTSGDYAAGLQTTKSGCIEARSLTVKTSGHVAAAIRAVRDGGRLQVSGGKYTTSGFTSPAVYSTGEIAVENAVLTANNSEALVLEGENSLHLKNCTVTGNMSRNQGESVNENVQTVMIYQSGSGIAQTGQAVFTMTGGSLTSLSGDMFYITNLPCKLHLSEVELQSEDPEGLFLQVTGNDGSQGWGEAGHNGAQVIFVAEKQQISGDIEVDAISTLHMELQAGSVWSGALRMIVSGKGNPDTIVVKIAEGCEWNLTGDSFVGTLENAGSIVFNGYTITLADGTILQEDKN